MTLLLLLLLLMLALSLDVSQALVRWSALPSSLRSPLTTHLLKRTTITTTTATTTTATFTSNVANFLSSNDNNNNNNNNNYNNSEDRLRQLGFSDEELRRRNKASYPQEEENKETNIKVRVDIVDNVDPVTLTAIGFAVIAINFLVLANLGDGGISGLVATIINSF